MAPDYSDEQGLFHDGGRVFEDKGLDFPCRHMHFETVVYSLYRLFSLLGVPRLLVECAGEDSHAAPDQVCHSVNQSIHQDLQHLGYLTCLDESIWIPTYSN
jgi:hypothetical protein